MINPRVLDGYKKRLTKGKTYRDIYTETYQYADGTTRDIFLLKGDFESEYQSRIYADTLFDCLNKDGTINTELMLECVSEPFRKYMMGEDISEDALKMIEGAVL